MGAWKSEPWDSDGAADWFGDFFSELKINMIHEAFDVLDNYDAARAASYILQFLGHVYVWPAEHLDDLKQLLENIFNATNDTQLFGFLDVISGGALANFSIMLIGLGPYINASIIMQLLTQAIPKLETLNKEGEYGRKKINQIIKMQ